MTPSSTCTFSLDRCSYTRVTPGSSGESGWSARHGAASSRGSMAGAGCPSAGYRGPQVCKIVGITYRQLDYWARTDLVRPSVCDADGSGTQRLYSYRDLVELKVVKSLLDAGVSLQTARKAIEYLRDAPRRRPRVREPRARRRQHGARADRRPDRRPRAQRPGRAQHRAARPGRRASSRPSSHQLAPRRVAAAVDARTRRAPRPVGERAIDAEQLPHETVRFAHNSERQFAKLLDFYAHRVGVRAAHVHARARPRRQPGAGVHARLLPARRTTSTSRSPR